MDDDQEDLNRPTTALREALWLVGRILTLASGLMVGQGDLVTVGLKKSDR